MRLQSNSAYCPTEKIILRLSYVVVYFIFSFKDADDIEYVQVYPEIVSVPDPEILKENLVESKHSRLTRSIRSGTMSRDLKPNASKRDRLMVSFWCDLFAFLKGKEECKTIDFCVCLKSRTLCNCLSTSSSSPLPHFSRNIGEFGAKKYLTDHQTATI